MAAVKDAFDWAQTGEAMDDLDDMGHRESEAREREADGLTKRASEGKGCRQMET